MKAKPELEVILKQIASIQEMERGNSAGCRGAYYNHNPGKTAQCRSLCPPPTTKPTFKIFAVPAYLKSDQTYAIRSSVTLAKDKPLNLQALSTQKRLKIQLKPKLNASARATA